MEDLRNYEDLNYSLDSNIFSDSSDSYSDSSTDSFSDISTEYAANSYNSSSSSSVSASVSSSVSASSDSVHWHKTKNVSDSKSSLGLNSLGAPLLSDSRDLFRPASRDIPPKPGVYKWRDGDGRVIYVGKAKNLRNRLANYFQPLDQLHPRTRSMVLSARSLEWTVVETEFEALTLEYTWIKTFNPRFNVVFRDDKTYPYVAVSVEEEFPRVWITRNRSFKHARYFGPYAKVWPLKHSLDSLLKTFPVRTCSSSVFSRAHRTGRPCLLASIGKCSAPCIDNVSQSEHRNNVEHLVGVLTGSIGSSYISNLNAEMKKASDNLEFERAAKLRDDISLLNTVLQKNSVVFDDDVEADVFGLSSDNLEASIHAFFVRSGMIRGEKNWYVERNDEVDDSDLLADLLTNVYAEYGNSYDLKSHNCANIKQIRDAFSDIKNASSIDSVLRAKATRTRHERQESTGREDLLAPISPVPREIIIPIELCEERQKELELLLSNIRGSKVTIHVVSRGSKHDLMNRANENANQALVRMKSSRINSIEMRTQAMNEIAQVLGLSNAPLRIECYDISNTIDGTYQVASMVVFEDAIARPSEYRRFSIHGEDGSGQLDDLSALYETIKRRFTHNEIDSGESKNNSSNSNRNKVKQRFAYKPNLIIVDGGKQQAIAAKQAMLDCGVNDVFVCGLSKKLEEVWLADGDYPIIFKRDSEGLYLLQRARDESHRFAIAYHRNKRRKGLLESTLNSIPGIGLAYSKRLLSVFGSVKKISSASLEELQKVPGIGLEKAKNIYNVFHK